MAKKNTLRTVLIIILGVVMLFIVTSFGGCWALLYLRNPCTAMQLSEWRSNVADPYDVPEATAEAVADRLDEVFDDVGFGTRVACLAGSRPDGYSEDLSPFRSANFDFAEFAASKNLEIGSKCIAEIVEQEKLPDGRVSFIPTPRERYNPTWIDEESFIAYDPEGRRLLKYTPGRPNPTLWADLPQGQCGSDIECHYLFGYLADLQGALVVYPYQPIFYVNSRYWDGEIALVREGHPWPTGRIRTKSIGLILFHDRQRRIAWRRSRWVSPPGRYDVSITVGTLNADVQGNLSLGSKVRADLARPQSEDVWASQPLRGASKARVQYEAKLKSPMAFARKLVTLDLTLDNAATKVVAREDVHSSRDPRRSSLKNVYDVHGGYLRAGSCRVRFSKTTFGKAIQDERGVFALHQEKRGERRAQTDWEIVVDLCGKRERLPSGSTWSGVGVSPSGKRVALAAKEGITIVDLKQLPTTAAELIATARASNWKRGAPARVDSEEVGPATRAAPPPTAAPAPPPPEPEPSPATPDAAAPDVPTVELTKTHLVKVTASSVMRSRRGAYVPGKVTDGDPETAWGATSGSSRDEWLELVFSGPVEITRLEILTGYVKHFRGRDLFDANSRIKRAEITAGSWRTTHEFTDSRTWHTVEIDPPVKNDRIRIKAVEIYQGNRWSDLHVSEIKVYGRAGEGQTSSAPAGGSGFTGQWRGTGTQSGGSSWPLSVNIHSTGPGECANVRYPSLGCRGVWICENVEGDVIRGRERITSGRRCLEEGTIRIRRDPDGTLAWQYQHGSIRATATLRRSNDEP